MSGTKNDPRYQLFPTIKIAVVGMCSVVTSDLHNPLQPSEHGYMQVKSKYTPHGNCIFFSTYLNKHKLNLDLGSA